MVQPPPVLALTPDEAQSRPRWSIMIPVHDCARFLPHVLRGVLEELGERDDVEIVVVDDNSSDRPDRVVAEVAGDLVRYERLDRPHGVSANFNACVGRGRGELIHLLHGDDGVLPGFYSSAENGFSDPTVVATFCRTRYIDELDQVIKFTRSERPGTGLWRDAHTTLTVSNRLRPASIAVRRSTYEAIGGFRTDLPHAADWEMWARIAAYGPMFHIDRVLAEHRVHAGSDTSLRVADGANIRERAEVVELLVGRLPDADRTRIARRAHAYSALFAARTSGRCLRMGRWNAAGAQVREVARSLALAARAPSSAPHEA